MLTEEQIITIKKAANATDHGKPWGCTGHRFMRVAGAIFGACLQLCLHSP